MADTTARALRLLELLQSAQLRTVPELADRLGVDERTVRRDVARLLDLGMPIEAVRGRYGGYRLATGRRVLPIMFGREEVVAVFLGLARAQAVSRGQSVAAQTALAKIKRAMPTGDAERIDALLAAMTSTSQRREDAPDPAVMLTLADAVDVRRVLELRYATGEGTVSTRTIHPFGLISHASRWYLLAYDTGKQEERTFRVDRIRTVRAVPGTFPAPRHPGVEERLLELFATADYRWHVVLHIRAPEDHVRMHLPASVARLDAVDTGGQGDDDSGWCRAEIRAESLDWIPQIIAALGCEVVVESPDELRTLVRDAATRLLRAAGR